MTSIHPWGPRLSALSLALCTLAGESHAQTNASNWQVGAVLDAAASSRELALGLRDQGLALGHSDVTAYGPLGRHLQAQFTAVAHSEDGKLEFELEEAWLQTRTLPAGLQVRAGRFASQIGYLNEQHPHTDDFVQRPLLHRAFFGGHWNDDGIRVNWTAPTDLYLRLGLEVFRGRRLVEDAASARRPGVAVLSARTGGDLGVSQSWQAGLSYLHNRREAAIESEEASGTEEAGEDHGAEGHADAHAHGAAFSGRRMWVAELAWKWSPQGNNNRQQVRLAYEFAQIRGLNRFASGSDRHQAQYLSAVWRFAQGWEAGVRHDLLRVRVPHAGHFDDGRLRETAAMLAWKPSHAQTLRLQVTQQRDRGGFEDANRAVQLQYILNFGAHAAHSF